ncbi:MAG TPA: acyltransferase domain-containing protein, partial [Candidatus Thermoplasmatota archaeon]|nr:acyltransferase domain-containing protein [Candidatus Thermoplasmatota archaeon]
SVLDDEEALKETSITQPAMLAADVAILRLLSAHGVRPDAVAGHSLGEYAALVAAGVLTFPDALVAVSARGKEMASVDVPDLGAMAGVAAPPDVVDEILRGVDGYVVSANKNSPKQTVIAGATAAVVKAMEACGARGLDVMPLPVSAAFHSAIVAPASEPLRRVLARLGVAPPRVPVIANVNVEPYPTDRDAILDLLSMQVAAPVEWQRTMHRLHADGVRVFVEVGPKRALTGFVEANLGDRPDVEAVLTNHPKKGGVASWAEAMARLAALGVWEPARAYATEANDARPVGPSVSATPVVQARPASMPPPAPARALAVPMPEPEPHRAPSFQAIAHRFLADVERHAAAANAVEERVRELGLELDDIVVSGASIGLPGRAHRVFDDGNFDRIFRGESGIDRLDEGIERAMLEKNVVRLVKDGGEPRFEAIQALKDVIHLAGRRGAFDLALEFGAPKEFAAGLDISASLAVGAAIDALRDAGIPLVRDDLVTRAGHRIPGQWVLPKELRDSTGIVVASAFPGLNNLVDELSRYFADRFGGDAYRELEEVYHEALELVKEPTARSRLTAWFAEHAAGLRKDRGERYTFNRHFLFEILSLGHAEVAEFVRARGPNTQVNSACASTAIAIGVAEDWIRTGRARRVLVLGADDVTSDTLMPWIGTGFLAAGAATTADVVAEAALPFDRRRHGMIVGMGAVGLVLERAQDVADRGMIPIGRLLATRISNSAFHGSRLHADHIEGEFEALVEAVCRRTGLDRAALASQTLFVSHETYTPARGGSAGAEVAALRRAFGASTERILIANVKGFTGHPMGAGIEDAVALKALQYGRVPPIANLKEPDEELGPLDLSRGGTHDRRIAIRFAAGFGSQLGIVAFEAAARGDARIADPVRHRAWLDRLGGGELKVESRAL